MQDKSGAISVVLCQDSRGVHDQAREIARLLSKKGHQMHVTSVENQADLLRHFETLEKNGEPGPDAVFMDVGGVGEQAALKVIKWFDQNRPNQPLPALNFLSLSTSMAITEATRLREDDARVQSNFVDPGELNWLSIYLSGDQSNGKPESSTFREFLNDRLAMTLPLDHEEDSYNAKELKKLKGVTNDRILDAWVRGRLSAGDAIERMRPYASGVATALQEGLYGGQQGQMEGLKSDAVFYASAGFPAKGKAVFSLREVEQASYNEEKPVLFMQSYDPAVVPVLASGKLGGLVVTSPYMASHLKLLCETHMVSGLFGMIPPGPKSLTKEFNEEARPDLPTYFNGGAANIAGKTVQSGQQVLVGLGGSGLALTPPQGARTNAPDDPGSVDHDEKLRTDLRNLAQLNKCFEVFFRSQGVPVHGVKANIDSADSKLLRRVKGIGLVRTEQMVATDASQVGYLKDILLRGDKDAQRRLFDEMAYRYKRFAAQLDSSKPIKIRLFDFVHREILNAAEQKQFVTRYGKLDIHGGEALETWPDLYRNQVEAIFSVLRSNSAADVPLEIMMPAVKTEEDVLKIEKMIGEEAERYGVKPSRYSFGVMIETLESCTNIGAIAKHCDFISFGTNDLTSEQFNMSRSDLKAHAGFAARHGYDPFKKLAPEILDLMKVVSEKGREVNPTLKIDVCGAQAADLATAEALCRAGIDNISVAPTISNLSALPVLLNYRLYDAIQPQLAPTVAPAETQRNSVEACVTKRSFLQVLRDAANSITLPFTQQTSPVEEPSRAPPLEAPGAPGARKDWWIGGQKLTAPPKAPPPPKKPESGHGGG